MNQYNVLLNATFLKDLKWARSLGTLLYDYPTISHKILKAYGMKIGEYHLDVITGKKSYQELYRKMFNISKLTKFFISPLQ